MSSTPTHAHTHTRTHSHAHSRNATPAAFCIVEHPLNMPNTLWKRRPAAPQPRRSRRRSGSGGMCVERALSDPTGKTTRGHSRRLSGDAHTTSRSSAPQALPSHSLDHTTIVVALRASPPTQNKKTAQANRPRIDTKAVVYGGIDRPYVDLTGMRSEHPPPAWQGGVVVEPHCLSLPLHSSALANSAIPLALIESFSGIL